MSRNIKEIGKELLGKSLNSYHRRTGLTQLEKNNNIQDGILDGILSQVDDAYIEKTEQSNVIHLEGSGDGAVVLDSIEGNTMVNIHSKQEPTFHIGGLDTNSYNIITNSNYIKVTLNDGLVFSYRYICMGYLNLNMFKPNTTYTLIFSKLKGVKNIYFMDGNATNKLVFEPIKAIDNQLIYRFTTGSSFVESSQILYLGIDSSLTTLEIEAENPMIFEGDYTNKLVSQKYFEGLQSSFEEKVNDEGKYEIEILMKNKNLIDVFQSVDENVKGIQCHMEDGILNLNGASTGQADFSYIPFSHEIHLLKGKEYRLNFETLSSENSYNLYCRCAYKVTKRDGTIQWLGGTIEHPLTSYIINGDEVEKVSRVRMHSLMEGAIFNNFKVRCQLEISDTFTTYEKPKQNKIKLLINEPLRGVGNLKDRFVLKNNKLMVERFYKEVVLNGTEDWSVWSNQNNETTLAFYCTRDMQQLADLSGVMCDNFIVQDIVGKTMDCIDIVRTHYLPRLRISKSKLITQDTNGLKQWLQNNPTKILFQVIEPYYEEVLNEYGEPIILEGYENGTIYIDSTIVPTTTVRYTPKMESMKAVKEVNNNNIMLINDINESIIPYMMEIDFMIMEKEMATMSHNNNNNIRIIGEKSMTSMQKRTKEMLERLIKGKSLTKEDAKTRVTVYLNAGKITDEQAEELMLTIEEVYA